MNVRADLDRCIGSGMCTTFAPQVFQLSDDGTHVVLLVEDVPPDLEAAVDDAVASCPVEALSTED
jgi:ferredoxin